VWVNDESCHGPVRWHFANAKNIRELMGSGTLGAPIALTNQVYNFPSGVTGKHGNQRGELTWLPVPGASSYNLRYSLMNGGPYSTLAGNTSGLDFTVGGLTNGLVYYFVVTAIVGGQEGTTSEQVEIRPFDTSQNVLAVGELSEGGQFTPYLDANPTNAASGQPSFMYAEHMTGLLNLRELCYYGFGDLMDQFPGTKGYAIFDWGGPGSSLMNIMAPDAITVGSAWWDIAYLSRQFRVNNVLGSNYGISGNPVGSLNVSVNDTNYHLLTVISPAQFNNARQFALRLTSTNNTSAVYNINEPEGYSDTFQFLFRGNTTLYADATGGGYANVQAVFLDDAPVTYATPQSVAVQLAPPTGFRIAP
jgi:hypothetical protein